MNILFNASQCGLGNNGGTKTIIRSAETLQDMGHDVKILAGVNKYTWHKPKVDIVDCGEYLGSLLSMSVDALPDVENGLDINMVSVSVWDLAHSIAFFDAENIKHFWWCRGWEKWVNGEQWLIDLSKKFVNAGGKIIVNASWLVDQFKDKCDIDVELCFAGLDLDYWKKSKQDDVYTIGAMKYERHKTKRSDLIEKLKSHIIKENKYSFYAMGIDSDYGNNQVRDFYSCCDIIFTPTELEGFHNVGAEANLCGCLVFCNRMHSNGMGDYATEETAECFSGWDELLSKLENPDFSKVPKMQKVLREMVGSREENMTKLVELIG